MEISCYSSSFRELHLDDIAFDTGHILVHFLHTGSYQCLKPQGDTTAKRHTSEFATALRTYVAAQSLQLLSLRDLAKGEIIRLGNKLSVLSLIDILEEPTSSLSTSPGIVAYAESRFLAFAKSITHPIAEKVLIEIGTPNTLSKVLLKTILLLKTSEVLQRDGSFQKKVLVEILRGLTDSKPGAGASTSKVSDLDQAMQEAEEKVAREVEEQTAKEETSAKEEKPAEAEDKPADDVETLEEKKFAEAAPPADEEKTFEDIPAEECKPSEDDEVAEVIPPAGELKPIDEEEEKTAAQEAEDVVIALEEAELAALVAKKAKSKKHKLSKTNAQRFSILTENAAKRAEAKAVAAPAAAESAPPVDEEEIFEATPTEEDKTSADTPNDEDKPAEAIPPAEEDEPAESRVASTDHSFVFPTPKSK